MTAAYQADVEAFDAFDAEADARMRFVLALRRAGVLDARILSAMERTPRRLFVPDGWAPRVWEDRPLPLPGGGVITRPSDMARLLDAAALSPAARVLEVGAGSGCMTAALCVLAGEVVSVERAEARVETAAARLAACGLAPELRHADGLCAHLALGPFDRIVVDGAIASPPEALRQRLSHEGFLVIAIGDPFAPEQRLTRFGPGPLGGAEDLGAIRLDPLYVGLA